MLQLAPLILRNILRNKRRSLLTLASTAISLALLTLMFALYQGFFHGEDSSPSEALRLICRNKVSLTHALPASYQQRIRAIDGVREVSTWSWFQGVYIDNRPENFFARFAVDADKIFAVHADWQVDKSQLDNFIRERSACAIGQKIADKHHIKIGDTVTIVGDIYPVTLELKCAAIYQHPPNTEALVFHKEYLAELLSPNSSQRDMAGTYFILANSPDAVPRIARAVDSMFDNSPFPTRTESEKEFGRSFLAFLGNIRLFVAAICAAVTFTILLVSANTVAMSVRERTREMAILRTLGFNPVEVLQLVVGEAILISIIGGLIGLAIGAVLAEVMGKASAFPFPGVKWQAALLVLAIATVVGLFASVVPAFFASRKNIVASLRFTG